MDMIHIEEVGDIEIEINDAFPRDSTLMIPAKTRDGAEIGLKFEAREVRKLWEFLSAIRQQKSGVLGVQ